jgi:hypothetical protein
VPKNDKGFLLLPDALFAKLREQKFAALLTNWYNNLKYPKPTVLPKEKKWIRKSKSKQDLWKPSSQ